MLREGDQKDTNSVTRSLPALRQRRLHPTGTSQVLGVGLQNPNAQAQAQWILGSALGSGLGAPAWAWLAGLPGGRRSVNSTLLRLLCTPSVLSPWHRLLEHAAGTESEGKIIPIGVKESG